MAFDVELGTVRRIGVEEMCGLLEELRGAFHVSLDAERGKIHISRASGEPAWEIVPPLVRRIPEGTGDLDAYLAHCRTEETPYLLLLFQAGAAALGCWREGELVRHKVLKKYVVRGRGKAQTTYLKTKGKSRYGSRLRLQNARAHLDEVRETASAWHEEEGPFGRVYVSCPVRLRPLLLGGDAEPLFGPEVDLVRIPLDVRVPCHKELLHIHYEIRHGRVLPADPVVG